MLVSFWTDVGHLADPPAASGTAATTALASGPRTTGIAGDAAQGLDLTLDKGGNSFYLRGSTSPATLIQAIWDVHPRVPVINPHWLGNGPQQVDGEYSDRLMLRGIFREDLRYHLVCEFFTMHMHDPRHCAHEDGNRIAEVTRSRAMTRVFTK